ncbi:NAD-dependent epimerase/dehydratase family protein [Ectobacillus panaciterrae]|uniref:NAD-dependent epimerase/dehydratase family protein n=1 Tax=Ectobacillus panaciterrae TaxID=363872 RepID=UPI00040F6170|nr:NAD-dependent epimerase/dehydratase family protein [Ectobacillus panaciterrae]
MILVIGGAGYIGSHTVKELLQQGHRVVVLDNLSTGHHNSLDKRVVFEKGNFGNLQDLDRVFSRYSVDAVIHLGCSHPDEHMVRDANQYYMDYVNSMLMLLYKMKEYHIPEIVFSSTSEVYGVHHSENVTEQAKVAQAIPYHRSQQIIEQFLEEFHQEYGLNYIILRYFNAAGAAGEIGEDHEPEAHLIPMVLKHALKETDESLVLDASYAYSREYLHVTDVAKAHVLCIERLLAGNALNTVYNLGSGQAASVKDIVLACRDLTGVQADVVYEMHEAKLTVSYQKIQQELGWNPVHSLEETIYSAWQWHKLHPEGYGMREIVVPEKLVHI